MPAWLLQRIRSERLIYPQDSGIRNAKPESPPLTMAELIRERQTGWARSAAASRAVRLRLLATGRGSEVGSVLGAYSRFLEAIQNGKDEAQLRALLADADRRFAAMETRMAGGRSAGTNSLPVVPCVEVGRTGQ
jgi:hypothetical protein